MITLYLQTKTPINFSCRQELNHRSLIQLSDILLVELTETHNYDSTQERNRDKCFEDSNRICRKKILYLRNV